VPAPAPDLALFALPGLPEVQAGADLAALFHQALLERRLELRSGDVLVVAQKVVSKAEGRLLDLATVEPSPFAQQVGDSYGKDPRHVETVLREAARLVRMDRGVIIAETRHGFICANAGVDLSNVPGEQYACLLPLDPDASAAGLREGLRQRTGVAPGVVISDTFGRPWREGATNIAIGLAGLEPLLSYVGQTDAYGYELHTTVIAVADELAAAAEIVMGKLRQIPAVLVRGYTHQPAEASARALVRAPGMDLFR
jgi:coenzyme F420-0:L-glutamate ligase/coenzyme F420-1:gamma-L-glutamate ligase